MTTYSGHCHCGEVEFQVKIEEPHHVICHCNTCKAVSTGAYTLNTIVPSSDFKITKGSTKTYTYHGDSGNPVNCYYCPNCTSHIYHHQTVLGDKYVIRTILLEGGEKFGVDAEIFGKDKLAWEPKIAQTFDVLPPGM